MIKTDDGKAVILVELTQDETQGITRLLYLVAAHAARTVHDEHNVLGDSVAAHRLGLGRKEEQEMILSVALPGQQPAAKIGPVDPFARAGQEELLDHVADVVVIVRERCTTLAIELKWKIYVDHVPLARCWVKITCTHTYLL